MYLYFNLLKIIYIKIILIIYFKFQLFKNKNKILKIHIRYLLLTIYPILKKINNKLI